MGDGYRQPSSVLFERFLRNGDELEISRSTEYGSEALRETTSRLLPSEAYEWQGLLDAVSDARRSLTMIELGAGYGRWVVRAAAAVRRYRPRLRHHLIAVEAEPTHFRWLEQHTRENRLRRRSLTGSCKLVNAAVSGHNGTEPFYVGNPDGWYGQALVRPENEGADAPTALVETVTLSELLRPLRHVDLIDVDIQGAELEVFREAGALLGHVGRVYVETHSEEIDEQLLQVFAAADGDWTPAVVVPLGARHTTPLGEADFDEGGVQLWVNRKLIRFAPPPATLRCPQCGEPVEPPRAAFFGVGEFEAHCPKGHRVVVANTFRAADETER